VIHGDLPRKIAFDIDLEVSHENYKTIEHELISRLRLSIIDAWMNCYYSETFERITDEDIYFMTSSGPKDDLLYKISFHILVKPNSYIVKNAKENAEFAKLVKDRLPTKFKYLLI
jgi:hypothetical protein